MEQHDEAKRPEKPNNSPSGAFRFIWAASYFMGIGIYLATTVVVCLWLGMEFDDRFGTAPRGRLAGIFLAFPAAIYSIYHKVKFYFGKRKK